ncbi:unnamed protein product, partial [Ixodes pacificus]
MKRSIPILIYHRGSEGAQHVFRVHKMWAVWIDRADAGEVQGTTVWPGCEIGVVVSRLRLQQGAFLVARTEGEARITPFEVNMKAMKGIQSIGKGSTALTDFCAALNVSHRGLHHKTFQCHLPTVMQACELSAGACEKWGHISHVGVSCIMEVYTGLTINHVVLCNLCLVCSFGPKPEDEGYSAWFAERKPECKKN